MPKRVAGMFVDSPRSQRVLADGTVRVYQSHLLRRSFRQDGKVRHETLANLSALPTEAIDAVKAVLAGAPLVAGDEVTTTRSLPHGHVAAVWVQAKALGLPDLLGPAGRPRDIVMALVVARVASQLATRRSWSDTTLAVDLGVADASPAEVYAALDWLAGQQHDIEAQLARRHLREEGRAYFDLFSSCATGTSCPPAPRRCSRGSNRVLPQIEYGLLTDPAGRPVAMRVFAGNTADPAALTRAVAALWDTFGLARMVMVGDRAIMTNARIAALRDAGDIGWLTGLRSTAIARLADGPLRMAMFDIRDPADITHTDYPGERLIAYRTPALAAERARKREALLSATERDLAKIAAGVAAGKVTGAAAIGIRVGTAIGKYKTGRHFTVDVTDTALNYARNQAGIDTEAGLDGLSVIRTSVAATALPATDAVAAYRALSTVERDFGGLNSVDVDPGPVGAYTESRARAHLLLCLIDAYLVWHLRHAWAPLTDAAPGSNTTTMDGLSDLTLHDLLDHLATLTRNTIRVGTHGTVEGITDATPTQRRAFELINSPIPAHLG